MIRDFSKHSFFVIIFLLLIAKILYVFLAMELQNSQALPSGTRLEEFVIERVLGAGGFGITYLAKDTSLGRKVVIKENLPAHCAFRDSASGTVKARALNAESISDFEWAIANFSREASTLAGLDHPNIAKVYRLFECNQTAYFVMPYVEGMALDAVVEKRAAESRPFRREEILAIFRPMLDALTYLHGRQVFHRDIKPGNIILIENGMPVLIDFGAARHQLGEHSATVIESPGYTPFEQLTSSAELGPTSDLYSLAATFYRLITFERPPRSADRMLKDEIQILAHNPDLLKHYDYTLLEVLDRALALHPKSRPKSAQEMLSALDESKMPMPAQAVTIKRSPMEFAEKLAAKALELRDAGKLSEAATLMEEAARDWPDLRARYGRMIQLWRKGIQM